MTGGNMTIHCLPFLRNPKNKSRAKNKISTEIKEYLNANPVCMAYKEKIAMRKTALRADMSATTENDCKSPKNTSLKKVKRSPINSITQNDIQYE